MTLVDTHCHLDFEDFDADREEVIKRAKAKGVGFIINVGSSLQGSRKSVELAEKYETVYAALGIHPHDAKEATDDALAQLKRLSGHKKVVAIGEVGLDYYRNLSPSDLQLQAFVKFIGLAKETGLALIIHCRQAQEAKPGAASAQEDLLKILKDEVSPPIRGVIHCFPPDEEFLRGALELGLYVSFTCNVTFKNASRLRELLKESVPIEKLLLETDAPFLAPEAFRGKRNEPSYLTYLVEELAKLKGMSEDDVARVTTLNSKALFGVGEAPPRGAIVYRIRNSLYVNLTNRCTDDCVFCVRGFTDYVMGHNLRLESEPSAREAIEAVGDPKRFEEVVFCGYGEPTLRLNCVIEVARALKAKGARIRLTTNGHGNLIHNRSIVGDLVGLIDKVSVSLNAESEEVYNRVCRPKFGPGTFGAIKQFIAECRQRLPEVEVTCIDMEGVDLKECERLATEELKVKFRPRRYNVVG